MTSNTSGARDSGERLRPERGAGGQRRAATPPSESERGWGPASSKQCRPARSTLLVLATISLALASACRQDMHDQPKYRGLRPSAFFTDGSSARPLVEGTIARGTLREDEAFFAGKVNNAFVKELPFPVDEHVLDRGEGRFNIYCTPCHGATGAGNGMVVQRGYRQPPSFHIDRLRQADPGYVFDVITNGFGAMPDYKVPIAPRDRWAIVAYIKALQLSQHAAPTDVPGGDPSKMAPAGAAEGGPKPPATH